MKIRGRITLQVCFNFGSIAIVSVTLYENKSLEECIKMRSERIEEYLYDGKWHTIA